MENSKGRTLNSAYLHKQKLADSSKIKAAILDNVCDTATSVSKADISIIDIDWYYNLKKEYDEVAKELGFTINWVKGQVIKN